MELELDVTGDVVERSDLLNGTQTVTVEGRSGDGAWALVSVVSWNVGLVEFQGEGDITLTRDDGAEIFGTLIAARLASAASEGSDVELELVYEVDGGAAAFENADGRVEAGMRLAGGTFDGRWTVRLNTT